MTAEQFSRKILTFPGVESGSHGGHADFRLRGKVIASLGAPDGSFAMLKLTPEQQKAAIATNQEAFIPCKGVYGERGYTNVLLAALTLREITPWMRSAVENQS